MLPNRPVEMAWGLVAVVGVCGRHSCGNRGGQMAAVIAFVVVVVVVVVAGCCCRCCGGG